MGVLTILQFYSIKYAHIAAEDQWIERIQAGQILCNNLQVVMDHSPSPQPSYSHRHVLQKGDKLAYVRRPWAEPDDAPAHFSVLYEDADLLAIHKPSGLQVLPAGVFYQRTCLTLLHAYHRAHRAAKYPASVFPAPMHRLGRGTSGVLVCACTAKARQTLVRVFSRGSLSAERMAPLLRAHVSRLDASPGESGESSTMRLIHYPPAIICEPSLESPVSSLESPLPQIATFDPASQLMISSTNEGMIKIYRAIVLGLVKPDRGTISVPIGLQHYEGIQGGGIFAANEANGKTAVSCFEVAHRNEARRCTVVDVRIWSGRPHQIRIHMAWLGHPLVGDPLYAPGGGLRPDAHEEAARPSDLGYMLHSYQLYLHHPISGNLLSFKAPVPEAMESYMSQNSD